MADRPIIDHVKVVNPKRGGIYYYFDTGQTTPKGAKIFKRLPDYEDRSFWPTYAALKSVRDKREDMARQLMLSGFIDLYRKSERWRKLAENSRDKYDIYLRKFVEAFNTAPADDVTRKDVYDLIDSMADRPGAANLQLKVIRALYAWGRGREHVSARPCDDIEAFEMGEHEPWAADLLEAGLASDDPFIKLTVHLLYYTGQRIGDVCKMRWSDYSEGRIMIYQEKTGARVSIPPHPDLEALLTITPKVGLTILARDAKPFKRQAVRYRLKVWAAGLGYKIVPHGLRKNAVNALLECGCSVAETAAITRQSLQVIEHYAKARNTDKLADAAVLRWSRSKK